MTTDQPSKIDQIEAVLLRVATQQEANTTAIAELIIRMNQAVVERAELRADAEADRKMIWAAIEQHYVVLARLDRIADENQQILNYLFGQQRGNGHDNNPNQEQP